MAKSSIRVGNIDKVSGEVSIAGRDIIRNINIIHQRALTAAEEAARARKQESRMFAQGVVALTQSLSTQASAGSESAGPYKGLLAYHLSEAGIFHGRKEARQDLLNCMRQDPLTVLHAPSGAGKTSLLQAGIAAQLIASGHLAVHLRTHDANPVDFIKGMFLPEVAQAPGLAAASLRDFLRQVCRVLGSKVNLYLLLDQFEEFFHLLEKDERVPFLESLADCLNDPSLQVRWVLALRAEALSSLAELESFGITPFKNTYRLSHLSRREAREAILEPARRDGIRFEEALIDHILDTLTAQGVVMPTHLQLVCSALTDELPEERMLTLAYYKDREGDTHGILRDYLKRQLDYLPVEEQALAWKILQELITADYQRAVKSYTEIVQDLNMYGISSGQAATVLHRLVERRLLVMQNTTEEMYELTHDYLLQEIRVDPEAIKRKQAEELLNDGIKVWRRNPNLLLGREHIATIEAEHGRLPLPLDQEKAEFLLLSASLMGKAPDPWLAALDEGVLRQIVSRSIENHRSSDPVTRGAASRVLWSLRAHVPKTMAAPLYVRHALQWLFSALPAVLLLLILLGFGYFWLSIPVISDWQALHLTDPAGKPAANLLLVLSPQNPAEIYAASQSAGWVSASADGGVHWRTASVTEEGVVRGLATAQKTVYAVSDTFLFVSEDRGATWSRVHLFPDLGTGVLTALAANPHDPRELYIGTSSGQIRTSGDGGTTWSVLTGNYNGDSVRALVTNGRVVIAATDGGLWAFDIEQEAWSRISLLGCDGPADPSERVSALAMPLAGDAVEQIGIWAVIPGKGVCDSDYRNEFETSLLEQEVPYTNIGSIAITGDPIRNPNTYLATGEGLFRQRTWHWFEVDWWKIKLGL